MHYTGHISHPTEDVLEQFGFTFTLNKHPASVRSEPLITDTKAQYANHCTIEDGRRRNEHLGCASMRL